jgi:hypothetical protein
MKTNGDGSPNFDVRTYKDVPTKAQLTELIYNLFKGEDDISLLFFAGHGVTDELDTYLVTPDAKKFDLGVSVNNLLKMANESKSRNRIIILDCCRSGAVGTPNIFGGHGVFTNLLIQALNGGASDISGNITPGSIYAYIDQALGAHDQRPVFKTNITEFTVLRKGTPQVPKEILRKIIEYFPQPLDEFALDPSYEETNSDQIVHTVIAPHAIAKNVAIFKNLQKYQSVGLVVPVDAKYMYFAAMESKACKLTPLGYHYWRLAKDNRIK